MKAVDYSDRAVTMRLTRLSQLRKLCVSLRMAKQQQSSSANRQPHPANRS